MLRGLAGADASEYISVDELLTGLGNHAFGLLLLILALPNAIPGPMIPGFSVPFALGIIVLSVQILQGHRRPLLPSWLRRRVISRERFRRFVTYAEPALRRFERWFRPRDARFMTQRGDRPRALGFVIILFPLVLALPIPLGNGPMAFAICILALGIFEGDEKVEMAGMVIGGLATLFNIGVVIAGVEIVDYGLKYLAR
jgi:hypothetical protein